MVSTATFPWEGPSSWPPLEHFLPLLECSLDCIKRPRKAEESWGKLRKADDGHCWELNALADYRRKKFKCGMPLATPKRPNSLMSFMVPQFKTHNQHKFSLRSDTYAPKKIFDVCYKRFNIIVYMISRRNH